ncbi:MAG TPA: D-alanyl-D-alanine carboxypeptidase/D-alanyl-D-alanine-endopeptidase [Thermoanaerobaculia bacterium]|nr:D-alanyl-D-alanine carboxypeptidase/D-alanyl-D-alanine-endopeptidase [Thermoanaerobaculia bacterium]
MNRPAFFLAALLSVFLSACATAPAPAPPAPDLRARIDAELARSPFDHALWGVHIEEDDGTVLYSRNAGILMMTASNRKLFTTALTESCFSLDERIPTELWSEGTVTAGVLAGNLVVKGYGDPSFVGRYDEGARDERLRPLLDALRARGITRVLGSVLGDGSEFDRETFHGTWQLDDVGQSYQTPIDALAFNENVVGVFYGTPDCAGSWVATDPPFVDAVEDLECAERERIVFSADATNLIRLDGTVQGPSPRANVELVAVRDASLYAAQGVHDFLVRNGIAIDNPPRAGAASRDATLIGSIESPPLFELLATMMKVSQNLYADTLFKRASIGPEPASFERSLAMERAFLTTEVGIDASEFHFADGSGLSVRNLVTPRSIVRLVRWLDAEPRRGTNFMIFATPGEQGTLSRRLRGLESRMRGTTGTISGVNTLSGYVVSPAGQRRYFSIMANHHDGGSRAAIAIIDAIVQAAADF